MYFLCRKKKDGIRWNHVTRRSVTTKITPQFPISCKGHTSPILRKKRKKNVDAPSCTSIYIINEHLREHQVASTNHLGHRIWHPIAGYVSANPQQA